ncbi:hypothetical protein KAR48_13535 [bacterium]|nr:hypothetical protein [bacterium]
MIYFGFGLLIITQVVGVILIKSSKIKLTKTISTHNKRKALQLNAFSKKYIRLLGALLLLLPFVLAITLAQVVDKNTKHMLIIFFFFIVFILVDFIVYYLIIEGLTREKIDNDELNRSCNL